MINKYEVKVFNSLSDKLRENWQDFEKNSYHHIFQTFQWQKLWLEKQQEHNHDITNKTILIYENKKLIMILPLSIKKCYGFKIITWSGFPFADYNIPLIEKNIELSKKKFNIIWKEILKHTQNCDCIILDNQPENILNQNNPFYFFLDNKINNMYHGINFNKQFELNKNEIDNIRYQTNRLKKLGKLDFKIAKDIDVKKNILDFIVQHKSKQYINTRAWNLFKQSFNKDFFKSSNLILKENSYITYMQLDDEIIAAHSGYIYENKCYYLFPVYNIKYQKFSVGKILLKKIIDDTKLKSLEYFDLTIGYENYKKNFSNHKFNSALVMKSLTLKGNFYIFLLRLKEILKKFLKKIKIIN